MTNIELAELIFPNINKTPLDYEKLYPERNLKEGNIVTRFAPSPTGFIHMGSLLTTFIARKVVDDNGGVFFLRIEDTDQERTVENGIRGILKDLEDFDIKIDEGMILSNEEIGNYGPYIQSQRKDIYQAYVKYLISIGVAYPCFCSKEELNLLREEQANKKERIGYYGSYAKCRDLTNEELKNKILNKESYTIRLKSTGDYNKKIKFKDLVRGEIEFPENDLDIILLKEDGLPTYHLAHVIDDHLMRTTHVLRGEEWLSSVPVHLELFRIFNFKLPKFAHLGLLMKIDPETGVRRKLSKRKDKEAAVSYYYQQGIPIEVVKLYLLTIANSNFEEYYNQNLDVNKFKFDFKKISLSGSLFDLEKLLNISKNYLSRLSAQELFNKLDVYTREFDTEFNKLINKYQDYTVNILNIEREIKKPRKDFNSLSEIKNHIWYMYDELFKDLNYDFQTINDSTEINLILNEYLKYYRENDSQEEWFEKIKELSGKLGYAKDIKIYKENPHNYKGHVGDIAMALRVALTSKSMTPNLYDIMKLLGKNRIKERINILINKKS